MIEIQLDGKTVQRTKNLRGVISRANKKGVDYVSVYLTPEGRARVYVRYSDTSLCRTDFESFTVAKAVFGRRRVKWGLNSCSNTESYVLYTLEPKA